jgi:hypothetical protein
MFRTRIELKQIGVRDEAKRLDGIGRCGRQYCSASWLPELRPVNLGVAKDQRLSLNPSQISGACGRLMCCLRYEHEFYVHSRKRFPKEGKVVKTKRGEEKVIANDIFRERVTLRGEDGEQRIIALMELREEAEAAGAPLPRIEDRVVEDRGSRIEDREIALVEQQELEELEEATALEDREPDAEVLDPRTSNLDPRPTPDPRSSNLDPRTEKRPHRRRGRRGGRRNRGERRHDGDGGNAADNTGNEE